MDLEYDRKFEEMKKYIPFLESMIQRLETTNSDSNPRQAQLDKIRSLRDLLMDKKKRMKMDNLLKCEQVLVNLYAKVEQRDALPSPMTDDSSKKEKNDLNLLRCKLKSVVSKLQPDPVETLPEIARASETEEVCVPGSKEPALFQRRPNIPSSPTLRLSPSKNKESPITKRTYTRVLLSPERNETYWSNEKPTEQLLYSRRSPKKSPRKRSPSFHKKERKKFSKNKLKYNQSKDLNITLNVPEDSLSSLNTKDILSRIINCSDNDVDITTLRELRTQILGELKETGTNDDISDIILKSYKNKSNKQIKPAGTKNLEVEEGELSDSESEAIESIYGSLVVLDKNKSVSTANKSSDKEKPRKIQICLVINSDKTKTTVTQEDKHSCSTTSFTKEKNHTVDDDLIYNDLILDQSNIDPEIERTKNVEDFKHNFDKLLVERDKGEIKSDDNKSKEYKNISDGSQNILVKQTFADSNKIDENSGVVPLLEPILEPSREVSEIDILQALKKEILSESTNVLNTDQTVSTLSTPLLHQPKITKVVNAKDIGPKKRISIESYKAKANTSSRHGKDTLKNTMRDDNSRKQSLKLTEKECERFNFLSKLNLTESSDDEDKSSLSLDDMSIDLAPKSPDHEDFADTGLKPPVIIPSDPVQGTVIGSEMDVDMRKLLPNLKPNDISTTPLISPLSVEMTATNHSEQEIKKGDERVAHSIIDPRLKRDITSVANQDTIKSQSVNVESIQSPLPNHFVTSTLTFDNINVDEAISLNVISNTHSNLMKPTSAHNLNMSQSLGVSPLLQNMTPNRTSNTTSGLLPTPNIPLLMTPCRIPSVANMTPNMTPSRNTFDNEDYSSRKHVYTPIFSVIESRDIEKSRENHPIKNSSVKRDIDFRESRLDVDYRDTRSDSVQRDSDYRRASNSVQGERDISNNCAQSNHIYEQRDSDRLMFSTTPSHPFGRLDFPQTPAPLFGRLDCPPTPTSSFGRLDCPSTPTPSFGRLDCPPTPTPSFGRLDCSQTPTLSFARLDCPPTPTPSFGRVDRPITPVHPFGRSDCPLTPMQPFGRGETIAPFAQNFGRSEYKQPGNSQDPRLNRSEYEIIYNQDDDRERTHFSERKFYSGSYKTDHQNRDVLRRCHGEDSLERNERHKNYEPIRIRNHSLNREDKDYGRSFNREYEIDRYSRNYSHRGRGYEYRNRNDAKNYDERLSYQRDRSNAKKQDKFSNSSRDCKALSKIGEDNKSRERGEPSPNINISINSSFQENYDRSSCSFSFDARRKRASSVGRTLFTINKNSEKKHISAYNDNEKKNRNTMNFRRACSVGREIEDSKLDFKGIKADLKSFKIKTNFSKSKDSVKNDIIKIRAHTESPNNFESRSEQKVKVFDKTTFNSRYSPRKNNRDPRIRRENSYDDKEYRSSSRNSKNYGIIYSNDNISKGTILGSGYGVKNYKIPKIKRPQEKIETSKNIDIENVSVSKNKSSDSKEKVIQIHNEIQGLKPENSIDDKNFETKDIKNCKNNDKELAHESEKKIENIEKLDDIKDYDDLIDCSGNSFVTNNKHQNLHITKKNVTNEFLDNDNKNQQKEPDINMFNTSSDSVDSVERRVTRSTRKNILEGPMSLELSPIKRSKKVKKFKVLESDFEENEILMCHQSKNTLLTLTPQTEALSTPISSMDDKASEQFDKTSSKFKESNILVNMEDKPVNTFLEPKKQEAEAEHNLIKNTSFVKQELNNKESSKFINNILEENDKQSEVDLDSSFGLVDLEMFSVNVTSDPVVDSINALIADLDHDLDSTKNPNAKSQFTKEICLNQMLENLTSEDENGKVTVSVASQEDELSKMASSNKELNIQEPLISFEDLSAVKNTDIKKESDSGLKTGELLASEISHNKSESEITIKVCEPEQDTQNKESEISNLKLSVQRIEIENINSVDNCSNDAVVSTSADGKVMEPELRFINVADKEIDNSLPIPDSTINNNVDDVATKSISPPTNASGYEINSDITSTNANSKDLGVEAVSSENAGTSEEIESIGKLLSILQNKARMKSILSFLDDQSSDNEKIKKKLEKISEIVSDVESTVEINLQQNSDVAKCSDQVRNKNVAQDMLELDKKDLKSNVQDIQEKHNIESVESSSMPKEMETVKTSFEASSCLNDNLVENITEKIIQWSDKSGIEELDNNDNNQQNISTIDDKLITKKKKKPRRSKKWNSKKKQKPNKQKLSTCGDAINALPMTILNKSVRKKPSSELQKLQEDLSEMFTKEDVMSTPGIRMCRLAKLVDEKKKKDDTSSNDTSNSNLVPSVVLKKRSDLQASEKMQKKKTIKNKNKSLEAINFIDKKLNDGINENVPEQGAKNKSLDRRYSSRDPYEFETDSVNETNNASDSKNYSSSDFESDSVDSTKSSEGTDLSGTKKSVKRKRGKSWQVGVIKTKNRRKKFGVKSIPTTSTDDISEPETPKLPDFTCFTDRTYCFRKHVLTYNCRICLYNGTDIVHHYKKEHPHTEVPLSRLSPTVAKEAIKESEDVNFQGISKIPSKKYVCRFCFKEFSRKKLLLEAFFWHVVSMHTGEYKQACSKCVNTESCPLDIDIPPPPKEAIGQLLGYICEKCNYTQISLENLKTHVIVWHNDEQTAVYTINLASLPKTALYHLLNRSEPIRVNSEQPRILRSSRSNQSVAEASDDESDSTEDNANMNMSLDRKKNESVVKKVNKTINIHSKITFESDINDEILNFDTNVTKVKVESASNEPPEKSLLKPEKQLDVTESTDIDKLNQSSDSQDILDYSHFKIMLTESGSKVYVCCINGNDYHYKTSLLISMKKHVQLNHMEKWDGYCCLCKVIVTPQGEHKFKDCFQHFLDNHLDSFPILENMSVAQKELTKTNEPTDNDNKSYINVRPLADLILNSSEPKTKVDGVPVLPVIESVVSLGAQVDQPKPSPSYPALKTENTETLKQYNYEEFQADIMSRKHSVVLEAMMSGVKLAQVFKCAGRFCSFTTDNAEDALLHASTHMRVGGMDSLNCVYCDFDSSGNAIDLITHVFKYHGCCPFVCSLCFYRAAASHLVNAHIKRVHDQATNAGILKTPFQTAPIPEDSILSREAAVPYYLCCDKTSPNGPCKFRTYTPGKFCEHLQLRHFSSTEFSCFICSTSVPTPAELICHLKTHGLKLYQCTWCVFGADNETELLEHASALHPTRQPKAYLRIITNKEGTKELRVLPLAHLNKSDVIFEEVECSTQKELPVREAERSIELEQLIGHTNFMKDSMAMTSETSVSEIEQPTITPPVETAPLLEESLLEETLLENVNILENEDKPIPRINTPTPEAAIDQSEQTTPILKVLTLEEAPQIEPDIVCLDSDDESVPPNVPNTPKLQTLLQVTSLDENVRKELNELFLCSKCKMLLKCGSGFRKHVNVCFGNASFIQCAHCPMSVAKRNIVSHHYNVHGFGYKETPRNYCNECGLKFSSASQAKAHNLMHHNTAVAKGSSLPPSTKAAPGPKSRRKRNIESIDKTIEPPEKMKKFGPQDIDKLPINPILDDSVVCALCEFNTKVRLNMVRHLQLHAQQQPVAQTAPVNPVPHLESNEKHFDKMLNLASSSIGFRTADRSNKSDNASALLSVPPETMSRYPKFVSVKQRLTCGAKDCSYISVDESMLKYHWETLHHDTNTFHCVHCPPYQQLDTTKPVTTSRILAHLKMHDENLYACSLCSYYHYRRQLIEKHLVDIHKGGQVMIVRDAKVGESSMPTVANASLLKSSAPTMDLKPWQCGLCKFKSLLRPEVADHCAKMHNSKMQFKCAYCAFRTSNLENIAKHQSKSHMDRPEEIFYFYYREGSVPDDADGTTLWQKQSQNTGVSEPKVKSEDPIGLAPSSPLKTLLLKQAVDLNLVKKEVEPIQDTIEELCQEFGEFCEPNGLKYKCSLCNNVIEDSLETMQSHLYEELKYRKWGCSICSYKAFHKEGLSEHMQTEHRQSRDPIALPVDTRVESWVAKLLEHQTSLIALHKENLAKQKEAIFKTNPLPSTSKSHLVKPKESSSIQKPSTSLNKYDVTELEKMFGPFGATANLSFCCPKCNSLFKEEELMHNHLESELNKIRWYCSNCSMKFQTYHEAQFHSRSVHIGQGARPVEATRDATIRAAWIDEVIKTQKQHLDLSPSKTSTNVTFNQIEDVSESSENSLLVVRYEKKVPTPEEEKANRTLASAVDSDDEKLIIDEPLESRIAKSTEKCPYCANTSVGVKALRAHILRHYRLKPFMCPYCDLNGTRKYLEKHQKLHHSTKPINLVPTEIPSVPPDEYSPSAPQTEPSLVKIVCLVCRKYFTEPESLTHTHDDVPTTFGKRGEVVVQCSHCHTLHKDVNAYLKHQKTAHPELAVNYVFSKLSTLSMESKELYACGSCSQKFPYLKDIKSHADANHQSVLKYTLVPKHHTVPVLIDCDEGQNGSKRLSSDDSILPPCKRTARKSTTKLPSTCARKSTTKLPFNAPCDTEEHSCYGMKPSTEGLKDVVTMMPFYNKLVPFTFDKLKNIINIDPVVIVEKQ